MEQQLQFQQLQKQQERRKEEKKKQRKAESVDVSSAEKSKPTAETHSTSQEESQALRELQDENGRLFKLLSEKDFEIKHLKKKQEEERQALGGSPSLSAAAAATKIVELSKKIRELSAELEQEKTRTKQQTFRIMALEKELQAAPGRQVDGSEGRQENLLSGTTASADSPTIRCLQDKLAAAQLKVVEYRNQVQASKQELKVAQKVLLSELGEDVPLQQLLASPTSFRGRAQQILALQTRVRDLEQQLNQRQSSYENCPSTKSPPGDRNLSHIRAMDKERREALERILVEHELLLREHEDVKRKLEASRARSKALSGEVKSLKEQVCTLLDKGRHDDELVDALLKQQSQMQTMLQSFTVQQKKTQSHQRSDEAAEHSALVHSLKVTLAEKDAQIKELQRLQHKHGEDTEDGVRTRDDGSGVSPQEGDITPGMMRSGGVSRFGHKLVLPGVGVSVDLMSVGAVKPGRGGAASPAGGGAPGEQERSSDGEE
ncbi:coiled-coil domain-containing protein 13 [Salarias fasciatus]|uniref:coiled-coil domain-containing protein 13 n=1 Tax=Salarias fasciatus TaxID=181472 RepID=UPI001176F6C0|nr:coiled-coil domain-containing protein 13 [Salarias fasciatus]